MIVVLSKWPMVYPLPDQKAEQIVKLLVEDVVPFFGVEFGEIKVHQSRVATCPPAFPAGYYWYGANRHSPGRPPKWTRKLLEKGPELEEDTVEEDPDKSEENEPTSKEPDDGETGEVLPEPGEPDSTHATAVSEDLPRKVQSSKYPLRQCTKAPNYWRC